MDDREQEFAELDFRQADRLVHQRQRFQRRARKASELINHLLARKGYAQTQSHHDLNDGWKIVAGEKWKNKTMVGNIRRGILEIVVESSATHQQLEFKKKKLLTSIQEQLPQNNIRDLKFRVGKINP